MPGSCYRYGMTEDTTVRLTYSELAARRGISVASARRWALRRRWPKQIGNDGLSRVIVPVDALTTDGADAGSGGGPIALSEAAVEAVAAATAARVAEGTADALRALGDAVAALGVQLIRERDRADRAEARVRELECRGWRRWWRL